MSIELKFIFFKEYQNIIINKKLGAPIIYSYLFFVCVNFEVVAGVTSATRRETMKGKWWSTLHDLISCLTNYLCVVGRVLGCPNNFGSHTTINFIPCLPPSFHSCLYFFFVQIVCILNSIYYIKI